LPIADGFLRFAGRSCAGFVVFLPETKEGKQGVDDFFHFFRVGLAKIRSLFSYLQK
jgi:hypothetical protein